MRPVRGEERDEVLLALYRKGDVQALSTLVNRYKPRLFAFILNMSGRYDEADDIFQEVWFRAINGLGSYREKSLLAWLTRIAHNLMIDRWRAAKPTVSLDATEDDDRPGLADKLAVAEPDPARQAETGDMARLVMKAVAGLPVEQREVFLMRVKEDLSFREIAEIQGVSINTSLARMQYALLKLRKVLAGLMSGASKEMADEL